MSSIGTSGRWKKTTNGWRYFYNQDDRKVVNRYFKPLPQVIPLNNTSIDPIIPTVWECVLAYITSPTDLRNLAATCRYLYKLVESERSWTYLIRTKFGYRIWLRHVRQTFYRPIRQQIRLHTDIETMEKTEVRNECTTIPTTFLINRYGDQFMLLTRAILRSYRYYLEIQNSKEIVYTTSSECTFRRFVSFEAIHSGRLNDTQRQTVPLSKLIYFYLADRRHLPVVNFTTIHPPK
jgi:hypothetical protein